MTDHFLYLFVGAALKCVRRSCSSAVKREKLNEKRLEGLGSYPSLEEVIV